MTGDLRRVFALSDAWLGITVSIALWGTLAGAFGIGIPGDRYGVRAGLRIMALFYLVSALGCALAQDDLDMASAPRPPKSRKTEPSAPL